MRVNSLAIDEPSVRYVYVLSKIDGYGSGKRFDDRLASRASLFMGWRGWYVGKIVRIGTISSFFYYCEYSNFRVYRSSIAQRAFIVQCYLYVDDSEAKQVV
jgi:hypothetical protein